MLFPFFSSTKSKSKLSIVSRQKGGGGSDGGGVGGGAGRSGGSSSSSSSSSGKSGSPSGSSLGSSSGSSSSSIDIQTRTIPITTSISSGGSVTILGQTYSNPPDITPVPIPAWQLFSGRTYGGGMRDQIFGTRTYGSGYPGQPSRGTAGRSFPFFFWPIAWPATVGGGAAAGLYLSNHDEYGSASNTSRPGGAQSTASFTALPTGTNTSITPSTFRVLSDDSTITALIPDILANCSSLILLPSNSSSNPSSSTPYTGSGVPLPEQVIQYYRAFSIALSLDGYNNTATFNYSSSSNTTDADMDTPLPTKLTAMDLQLMDCLNQTIALAAPLIIDDSAAVPDPFIDGAGPNLNLSALGVWWVLLWMFIL